MEKIEVFYRELYGIGLYHKYAVYTNKDGKQFATSGWKGEDGDLEITKGVYDKFYPDHPNRYGLKAQETHPSETIATGNDLSQGWADATKAMQDIDNEGYDYSVPLQNSNTALDSALRTAGFPEPQNDDLGEYWAPASGRTLTHDNLEENADAFWGDLKKVLAEIWNNPQDSLDAILKALNDLIDPAGNYVRSPLAFDLDDDGIEVVATKNGVLFDHDANGVKNQSAWLSGDDAWLALDKNGNGTIQIRGHKH
jgi:hypothetical protein